MKWAKFVAVLAEMAAEKVGAPKALIDAVADASFLPVVVTNWDDPV